MLTAPSGTVTTLQCRLFQHLTAQPPCAHSQLLAYCGTVISFTACWCWWHGSIYTGVSKLCLALLWRSISTRRLQTAGCQSHQVHLHQTFVHCPQVYTQLRCTTMRCMRPPQTSMQGRLTSAKHPVKQHISALPLAFSLASS
jgi:hypothetical protein